jgi:FtsP/CotA-like multicopper oxidase with cupredoxin domain
MSNIYLPWNASRTRLKEAENARKNRLEIVKALSHGQISRRELTKWGLITAGGMIAPIGGLSPFVKTARAQVSTVPTGASPSPGVFGLAFTQPMLRLEVLQSKPAICVDDPTGGPEMTVQCQKSNPASNLTGSDAERQSCQNSINVDPALGGGSGPCEGRPPGPDWAHQYWAQESFQPKVTYDVTTMGARTSPSGIPFKFHPSLPTQGPDAMWTFNGTLPPKLVIGRYGEPILFRHHNGLPAEVTQNGGFGRHTLSTHEHNGHHGAENDGFTGAFFYPNQYYDYHWPIVHAGFASINTDGKDLRSGSPDNSGGITKLPGDWQETMSTHWFHDHMFGFTSQNVYKGIAAMFNIYSSIDRGNEAINDGVNFRLPSGTAKSWANLDYDVNLMLADKAWDSNGQLYFDIFDFTGFVGDAMTVNGCYKPYFQVEARQYRFRILNASVSRFFKLALSDGSDIMQIGNDGNLLPNVVRLGQLDEQGIAERYDIVIDFSRYKPGQKVWLTNLAEHRDGAKPNRDVSIADALAGKSTDPCVGEILEFRVVPVNGKDLSTKIVDKMVLIPNPDLSKIPVARTRTFQFGQTNGTDSAPWTIITDGGRGLNADFSRVSAMPKPGTREIWNLVNIGGGWDHPIHIHFEEGQILARNGSLNNVLPAERGRKDVYRLHPGGSVQLTMQFREFSGMYMEHCHNTVHEDNAMLLRWEPGTGLVPLATPNPSPNGVTFIPTSELPTA